MLLSDLKAIPNGHFKLCWGSNEYKVEINCDKENDPNADILQNRLISFIEKFGIIKT